MTKFTLTETQYEVLLDACSKAENPGACKYSQGCVVAKLCDFYGVSYPKKDDEIISYSNYARTSYPMELLREIQATWDNFKGIDVEVARAQLLEVVKKTVTVKETKPLAFISGKAGIEV